MKDETVINESELMEQLAKMPEKYHAQMACMIVGHSMVQSHCFGYWNCCRCGEQVGDSLAGSYSGADVVSLGHDCDKCRENAKALNWTDMVLLPEEAADYVKSLLEVKKP